MKCFCSVVHLSVSSAGRQCGAILCPRRWRRNVCLTVLPKQCAFARMLIPVQTSHRRPLSKAFRQTVPLNPPMQFAAARVRSSPRGIAVVSAHKSLLADGSIESADAGRSRPCALLSARACSRLRSQKPLAGGSIEFADADRSRPCALLSARSCSRLRSQKPFGRRFY